MESYGLDESINGTTSALPFMVLKYPEGDFGGTRTKCTFNLIPSGEIEMETMILVSHSSKLLGRIKAKVFYSVLFDKTS